MSKPSVVWVVEWSNPYGDNEWRPDFDRKPCRTRDMARIEAR